ncbi:Oligosaccharide translocation protein RFT1 [Penicillium rolfsii]|nr:Oligosaccharide translocation protein RFT1 [Penicillium rolfsii]
MSHPIEARMGNMLASSATGTTFLIMIQLASRIFTFASNQLILRTLSPIVLGLAAQLELYQVTILYFSRESIRLAIQRQPLTPVSAASTDTKKDLKLDASDLLDQLAISSQSVVNVSYLSLCLGLPFTILMTLLYQYFAPAQAIDTPFFQASVAVTGLASLLELCIEPFFAVIQQRMWYEKRAAVEMPAAFLRSLVTCSSFLIASRINQPAGALPFALGHLSYSIALLCGYCWALLRGAGERRFTFLLTKIRSSSSEYLWGRFPRHLMSLAASVFVQSLVKHLLTQGDSMMLAALSTLEDQGIYSLAANYGGLVARIIFQPLEESSRNLFSTLLSPDDKGKRNEAQVRAAKKHLIDILRAYQVLSVLIFPLGPLMVPQVLRILGGQQWASNKVGDLLSLYCYYIPFLALNGITEAFVSSAANSREIRHQTIWMGGFSTCYALAAYLFLEVGSMGAYGLVLANIVNMVVRTLWSYGFIRTYLYRHGDGIQISEVSMRPITFIVGVIATTIVAKDGILDPSGGIMPAILFSGVYGLLVLYMEKQYVAEQLARVRQVIFSRSKGTKSE